MLTVGLELWLVGAGAGVLLGTGVVAGALLGTGVAGTGVAGGADGAGVDAELSPPLIFKSAQFQNISLCEQASPPALLLRPHELEEVQCHCRTQCSQVMSCGSCTRTEYFPLCEPLVKGICAQVPAATPDPPWPDGAHGSFTGQASPQSGEYERTESGVRFSHKAPFGSSLVPTS